MVGGFVRWWIAPEPGVHGVNRGRAREGECKGGEKRAKKAREERRTPAPATRAFLVRSAQLKHRRAATARLLLPAAALCACNEANRATGLARGCSSRPGNFRRNSARSATSRPTSILFGGLRGTSTACAYEPQGCNYATLVHDSRRCCSKAHPCTAHLHRFGSTCASVPTFRVSFLALARVQSSGYIPGELNPSRFRLLEGDLSEILTALLEFIS